MKLFKYIGYTAINFLVISLIFFSYNCIILKLTTLDFFTLVIVISFIGTAGWYIIRFIVSFIIILINSICPNQNFAFWFTLIISLLNFIVLAYGYWAVEDIEGIRMVVRSCLLTFLAGQLFLAFVKGTTTEY